MPIYEYQCATCQKMHEALQKISDAPLTVCPHCGTATLRKQIAATAFRLKGGGWYETDFKKTGQRNLASTDTSPTEPAPAKSSETAPSSSTGE